MAVFVALVSFRYAALAQAPKEGTLKVGDHCAVSIDQGTAECLITLDGDGTEPPMHPTGKKFDFWYKSGGKVAYFNPQNGTAFAIGSRAAADLSGCTASTFSNRPVRVDPLPVGTHICLRSKEGRIAKVELKGLDANRKLLSIGYVTWKK
jgi:hypothetical protein